MHVALLAAWCCISPNNPCSGSIVRPCRVRIGLRQRRRRWRLYPRKRTRHRETRFWDGWAGTQGRAVRRGQDHWITRDRCHIHWWKAMRIARISLADQDLKVDQTDHRQPGGEGRWRWQLGRPLRVFLEKPIKLENAPGWVMSRHRERASVRDQALFCLDAVVSKM